MNHQPPNLCECESRLCYCFNDRNLLKKALTHSSCASSHIESNERLEFLGDSVLGLVISNLLYVRFPQFQEGELSRIKSVIVSRKTCKKVADKLLLEKFLFLGRAVNVISDSIIANVMESVIGAIFLDGGYEKARNFIEENFIPQLRPFLNINKFEEKSTTNSDSISRQTIIELDQKRAINCLDNNFKAKLQTITQREHPLEAPQYILLDEKGPPHCKCFKIAVRICGKNYQAAWGKNKKETEQRAAENAFFQLRGLSPPHSDGEEMR